MIDVMKEWLCTAPEIGIPICLVLGCSLLIVLALLLATEDRFAVRKTFSFLADYVCVLSATSMLLVFVVHYLPRPLSLSRDSGDDVVIHDAREKHPKDAYDFYQDNFSDLLTVLSVLGTLFGVVVPFGAYLLQKRGLKEETADLRRDFHHEYRETHKKLNQLTKDLGQYIGSAARHKELDALISRHALEGVRLNLQLLTILYKMDVKDSVFKEKLVKTYLSQFLYILRFAVAIPERKGDISDLKRFEEDMKLFQSNSTVFSAAVENFKTSVTKDCYPSKTGLLCAYKQEGLEILERELFVMLPMSLDEQECG